MPSLKNPIIYIYIYIYIYMDGKEEESLRHMKSGRVQLNGQPSGVKRKGVGSEGGYSHLPLNFHTIGVTIWLAPPTVQMPSGFFFPPFT